MNIRRNIWKLYGAVAVGIGICLLLSYAILILFNIQLTSDVRSFFISGFLGFISIGLAMYAIGQSREADRKYTGILTRLDKNVISLLEGQDTLEGPITPVIASKDVHGKVTVVTAQPTARTGVGTGTLSRTDMSKADAQKRLDEDTKKVGYVRGEIYQLKDGSWGIHWGGKYPL